MEFRNLVKSEFYPLSEDEKYNIIRSLLHEDYRSCGDFVLDVISSETESIVIRVESLKILRDLNNIPDSKHTEIASILNRLLRVESDIVLQQHAAFCVGPYIAERILLPRAIDVLEYELDVQWNLVDSISENIEVASKVKDELLSIRNYDVRSELLRILSNIS